MYRPENLMLVVFNLFYLLLIIHFINSLLDCLNCVICWLAPLKNLEFLKVFVLWRLYDPFWNTQWFAMLSIYVESRVFELLTRCYFARTSLMIDDIYIYCFNTCCLLQSAMFYLLLVIVHFTKTCLFKLCNMLINTAGKSWVQLCLFRDDRKTRARTQSHTRCYVSMINPACLGCWRAAILRWAV